MATIKSGKQFGNSRANWIIATDGKSGTAIELGDQHDDSVQNVVVYDLVALHRLDPETLATELRRLATALHAKANSPERQLAAASIDAASAAAAQRHPRATGDALRKAGKWALDVATTIGAPVAQAALKAVLGL